MIVTPHILTSVALSRQIDNVYLLAVGALALHFLIDKIPHWDYKIREFSQRKRLLKTGLDTIIGFALVSALGIFTGWGTGDYFLAFIAYFFGMLPDFMSGFHFTFPENKYFLAWWRLNKKLHAKTRLNMRNGLPQEITVSIIAIILIILK